MCFRGMELVCCIERTLGTLKEEQCFDLARLWMAFNLKVIVRTIICDETFCSTNVSSIQSSRFKM